MRLVNTTTFQLEGYINPDAPYAILSHTWGDQEVLFTDMANLSQARRKSGWAKLEGSCNFARQQVFHYIWIDTCCINKTSSAELSEAINSMCRWYAELMVCCAYFVDMDSITDFKISRWFTREWTYRSLLLQKGRVLYSKLAIPKWKNRQCSDSTDI